MAIKNQQIIEVPTLLDALDYVSRRELNEQDWDDVLDVNLKGTFLMSKAALKVMFKKRCGSIVNISSVVILFEYP